MTQFCKTASLISNKLMGFLFAMLLMISCKAKDDRIISLNEIGWTFGLPSGISFKDSAFNENGQIKKSSWEPSFNPGKPRVVLFSIEHDKNNYFNTIIYEDSSANSNWQQHNLDESRFYFSQLMTLPNHKIADTSLLIEKIDGVSFQREYFKVYSGIKNDTSYSYKFSRRYNVYDININIRYTDVEIGNKYLDILRKSKFEK